MKLVPPKDLGIIVHPKTIGLKLLFIATSLIESTGTIHLDTIHLCIRFFHYSTNTLEHALVFLKYMKNEHVFMNLKITQYKVQPSLILTK